MIEYGKDFDFHEHLTRLIKEKLGGRKKALADGAGISPAYMTQITKRENEPTRPILIGMAEALGVSLNYLMTGKEYSPQNILSEIKNLLSTAKDENIEIPNEETRQLVLLLGRNQSDTGFTSTLLKLLKKPDEETRELKQALTNLIEISLTKYKSGD